MRSEPLYLSGTIENLNQEVKIELPEEAVEEVAQGWHDLGKIYAKELKDLYKAQFMVTLAENLYENG